MKNNSTESTLGLTTAMLSKAERGIIKSPTGWITDDIINAAQNTLQEQFGLPGSQSVVNGQGCNFDVEPEEFVQILHNGKNHWVTIMQHQRKTR